jgi:hypothetical protein
LVSLFQWDVFQQVRMLDHLLALLEYLRCQP